MLFVTSPPISTPKEDGAQALRILILAEDGFPPARVDVAHLLAKEMVRRGHGIDFILQSRDPNNEAYVTEWSGCKVWVGPTDCGASRLRRLYKHLLDLVNDIRVFSITRSDDYDFIVVKDKFLSALIALAAARIRRLPFAYWLSYPFPEASILSAREGTARYPWLYRIRGFLSGLLLYRILLPAASHIFVQSEQMRRDVEKKGRFSDRITAVPMGVCMAEFAAAAEARGGRRKRLPAGVPCIVYLGTLNRLRRLDFVLRVLAVVRQNIPAAMLYLVGGGDDPADESWLVDEARRLGIYDGVVFTGQLPRDEALSYTLEADVCVSPFYPTPILNSTSPTKLIEYMALAKPVVANDHPEQRLVIEQSGGGYCVPYDEQSFARAIIAVLGDPDAAAHMGERGRRYVLAHRDYRVIADRVERELIRIAAARTMSEDSA